LQTIVSRNLNPLDGAVISVTYVRAGDAYNVIPQEVVLRGTIRVFRHEIRDFATRRMREIIGSSSAAMNCTAEIRIVDNTDPVINDAGVAAHLRDVFSNLDAGLTFDQSFRTMAAEDVSFFMNDVPGTYFLVGARDETADAYY